MPFQGRLQIQAFQGDSYTPVPNAKIIVTQNKENSNRQIKQTLTTDSSGLTQEIELEAPPLENSMKPSNKIPYSKCDINVQASGYKNMIINGCQIYPDKTALQQCRLKKIITRQSDTDEIIDIGPNRLVGNYPPKIPESTNIPDPKPASGLVVLDEPVVPQYIIVHAGVPDDPSAPNYTVRFKDYIKNVASCEIFSTWPEAAIRANIFCILSFTLNRIYTEFYRGKGKDFNITNSTAFDHAFTYGRNIYTNINRIVDDIFTTYVKKPGKKQPLLTQYCDGKNVQCPGWLTQWGSKDLGDKGYTPTQILKHFYGEEVFLTTAKKVKGIPKSYPGYTLNIGSTGQPVKTIQTYLNAISENYPAIKKVAVNSVYNKETQAAVKQFQEIFNLPQTGVTNYATWYAISDVYVSVTKMAELKDNRSISENIFIPPIPYNSSYSYIPTVTYEDDWE